MAATSAEREARSAAQQARQDGELARSQLVRAEARLGEQELAMQRMATQVRGRAVTVGSDCNTGAEVPFDKQIVCA